MSAFIVDAATIDTLITAWIWLQRQADGCGEPIELARGATFDRLGAMLWHENHKSVNELYSEDTSTPSYRFESVPFDDMSAAMPRVLGAIRGYVYQSCEHEGWRASAAYEWTEALTESVLARCQLSKSVGWVVDDCDRNTVLREQLTSQAVAA